MRDERRRQFRAELIARLERVRGTMTDAEFGKLLTSIEQTAVRFAEIDAGRRYPFTNPPVENELEPG
jgi:hypothetical protein